MNAPPPPLAPYAAPAPPAAPSAAHDFVLSVVKIAAASLLAGLIVDKLRGASSAPSRTYVVVNEDGDVLEEGPIE